MMTVPAAVAAALEGDQLRYAWLLKIGDDLHFTNHAGDVIWDGNTYRSEGDVLRFPTIVRERAIKLQSYVVEFSGVDGAVSLALLDHDRTGETCEVFLMLFDSAGTPVGDPISLYKGAFDSWVERETTNASTISVKITSPWAKPNLTAGRMTSNHNQQDRYSDDKFFEFAHEEKNTIGWGGGT